jgi:uncharacterized protein (TIGR03067 family)
MRWKPDLCIILGGLLLVGHAPAGVPQPDQNALQGKWKALQLVADGKSVPARVLKTYTAVIKDNTMTFWNGSKKSEEVTFALNPGEDPKHIEIVPIAGPRKGKTHHGIYLLDKSVLKLCWAEPDRERPRTFESKPKSKVTLIVLERTKP